MFVGRYVSIKMVRRLNGTKRRVVSSGMVIIPSVVRIRPLVHPKLSPPPPLALQPFVGPWPLLQFHYFFTQTVGLLGRVISPSQGLYLHTGQHKHRINVYTNIHALIGIRTHDPSVRASEDSSCLRPRGHCDRLAHN
jgi:hypothetical protein